MISVPRTYAQWADILDLLKKKQDDAEVLEAMRRGTLEWQAGVADRFSRRLIDVVNARMNDATDKFQRDIRYARGAEGAIIQALLALRRELAFLTQVVDLPALPDQYRKRYMQLIRDQADTIQRSLENSAKVDRSGKLASITRNHRVNAY